MRKLGLLLLLVCATIGIAVGGFARTGNSALWALAWVAWAPVGYTILLWRPRNGVGRAALLIGFAWGVGFFGSWVLERLTSADLNPSATAAWVEMALGPSRVIAWMAIVWLVLVFPSGQYPGRPERVAGRLLLLAGGAGSLGFILTSQPQNVSGMESPLAVPGLDSIAAILVADQMFSLLIGLLLSSVVLLIRRWRRSRGIERVQYRWLLLGTGVFAVTLLVGNLILSDSSVVQVVFMMSGWAIPVSVAVAVLRYRLFEIDRIISRTLAYAVVVIVLGGLYAGMVTVLGTLLPSQGVVTVAGSTLAAAALINPLRRRVQHAVDKRFNRSAYLAEVVTAQLGASISAPLSVEELVEVWNQTVIDALQPRTATIWLAPAYRRTSTLPPHG